MNLLQNTLNQLLKVSTLPSEDNNSYNNNNIKKSVYAQQIQVSDSKGNAHLWSIFNTSKYLSEVIELPQYADVFKAHEINGLKIIAIISPDDVRKAVGGEIDNNLHLIKISSHSQLLLKREGVGLDLKLRDGTREEFWNSSVRIAAWLRHCSGLSSLTEDLLAEVIRSRLTGKQLVESSESELGQKFPSSSRLVGGLLSLRSLLKVRMLMEPKVTAIEVPSDPEELVVIENNNNNSIGDIKDKKKKKKKRATAMRSRRERHEASSILTDNNNEQDDDSNNNNNSDSSDDVSRSSQRQSKQHIMSPIVEEISDSSDKEEVNNQDVVVVDSDSEIAKEKKHKKKNQRRRKQKLSGDTNLFQEPSRYSEEMKTLLSPQKHSDNNNNDSMMREAMKELEKYKESDLLLQQYKEERKDFLKRISALNKVVEDSSNSISELRSYSKKLREQTQDRDRGSLELIKSLKRDRDLAVGELEKLVTLYRSQSLSEKRKLKDEVVSLLEDKAKEVEVVATMKQSLNNTTVNKEVYNSNEFDDNLSDDSDLDDSLSHAKRRTASKHHQQQQQQQQSVSSRIHHSSDRDLLDLDSSVVKTKTEKEKEKVVVKPLKQTVSLEEKEENNIMSTIKSSVSQSDNSLVDLLNHTCVVQKNVFKKLLLFYKVSKPLPTSIEDTQMILNHVSLQWVKLGSKMLADSYNIRVSDEFSKEYLSALKGLRKCSVLVVDNSPFNVEPSERELLISIGMVFGLGLVKKILNQHKDPKDQNQLLFLLNQITYGELPINELSRDNLRDFLESNFTITMVWDKFDSLCQKIDKDQKKGFITVYEISESFRMFNNTSNKVSPYQSQLVLFVLLTITCEEITRTKQQNIATTIMEIINNNPSKKSFQTFLHMKTTTTGRESEFEEKIMSSTSTSTTTIKSHLMGSQILVSDILKEITSPLIDQLREILYRFYSGDLLSNPSLNNHIKELSREPYGLMKSIEYLVSNHDKLCLEIAHTLRIYEKKDLLIQSLSTCLIAFMSFRLSANIRFCHSVKSVVDDTIAYKYIQQEIIHIIEDQFLNITTKEEEVLKILQKIYSTHISKYETFMSDLLGVSVPSVDTHSNVYIKFHKYISTTGEGGILSLCQFECELIMVFIKQLLCEKPQIKSIQNESTRITLQNIRNEILNAKTTTNNKSKQQPVAVESHIISVVDDEIHTQRLTQLSQYLDLLNVKAAKKKKILQSLLSLWQSAKLATGVLPDINNKKELLMSTSEILNKVRDIQKELLVDIQEKPNTKYNLLANKVNLLKRAISQKIVIDSDMTISSLLAEISAMENSLLTANSDAMKIATRINHHLSSKESK